MNAAANPVAPAPTCRALDLLFSALTLPLRLVAWLVRGAIVLVVVAFTLLFLQAVFQS